VSKELKRLKITNNVISSFYADVKVGLILKENGDLYVLE